MMLAWRLLLATGEPRFADLFERTLHNVVATSPAPDGRHFFYANPLHQRSPGSVPPEDEESRRAGTSLRAPVVPRRLLPDQRRPHAGQPRRLPRHRRRAAGSRSTSTPSAGSHDARRWTPRRRRRDDGVSRPTAPSRCASARPTAQPWALTLRVPAWASGAELVDADGRRPVGPGRRSSSSARSGPGTRSRSCCRWRRAGRVPDPRIDAVRGCVAVERGPLVMCAESVDLPGGRHVDGLRVDPSVPPATPATRWSSPAASSSPPERPWPYGDDGRRAASRTTVIDVPLVPYHTWANRGPSTMRVWLPTT